MPPDSASPASPPPASSIFDLFERLARAGTTACTCGGPKCPGTLARAARPDAQRERIANLEKRVEFQRELARLINRLSLERTFGNRTDFDLARLAWDFLEVKPLPTPTTDVAAESPKPWVAPTAARPEQSALTDAMHAVAKAAGYRIVEIALLDTHPPVAQRDPFPLTPRAG